MRRTWRAKRAVPSAKMGEGGGSCSESTEGGFLAELARRCGRSEAELIDAGYDKSVRLYVAEGKTVGQVFGAMESARKHSVGTVGTAG